MRGIKTIVTITLLNIIIIGLAPNIGSEETNEIQVEVMIDFGNGDVKWTQVALDSNKTAIYATEVACERLNLDIMVIWSQWGAFISGIGDAIPPMDYSWWWGFFVWNETLATWEASSVGAGSIVLNEGAIIGWYPVWDYFNPVIPLATPSEKYPWPCFQKNGLNIGATEMNGPQSNAVAWIFDTQTRELAASPIIAQNKVFVNNYGGTLCLDEDGVLLWRNSQVMGIFSPTIGYEGVLVGGKDGNLYSLNKTNGEIIWKTRITEKPGLSGVTSPTKIEKDRIFLGSYDATGGTGYLYCLKMDSGDVIWKNTTLSSVYFSSPCVLNDRVYVGTMGLYNSSNLKWETPYGMFCFNAENGDLNWRYSVDGSIGSSPTVTEGKLLFTSKDGYLYCLDSETGQLEWKKEIGDSVSSPAVFKERIFVGSGQMNGEGMFYSLDLEGNIIWEFKPNGAVQSSPAVSGDYVYFATNVKNGTVYCLKRENGHLIWKYRPWPEEYIISSPGVVNGKMYIASDNGRLYCFGGSSPNIIIEEESITEIIHVGEDASVVHRHKELGLTIKSIEEDKVVVEFKSALKTFEIQVGKSEKVDTDCDGQKDLLITVSSVDVSSQSASITFEDFSEAEEGGTVVYLIIVVAIIVAVIALLLLLRKRKNRLDAEMP